MIVISYLTAKSFNRHRKILLAILDNTRLAQELLLMRECVHNSSLFTAREHGRKVNTNVNYQGTLGNCVHQTVRDSGADCRYYHGRMKTKSTILLMILTLLTNHMVLAGMLIDQHDYDASSSEIAVDTDTSPEPIDHSDHADHCCHIQAHFQTVLSSNTLISLHSDRAQLIPRSNAHLNSHSYSPPTPPPKA